MSATDELRMMLDEHGIEWMPCAWEPQTETFYKNGNGVAFIAMESLTQDYVLLRTDMPVTPAQAIAATLGDTDATCERHGDADERDQLKTENAKLRELVQEALASHEKMCTQRGNCFGCQFFETEWSRACPIVTVNRSARELGIEVEE